MRGYVEIDPAQQQIRYLGYDHGDDVARVTKVVQLEARPSPPPDTDQACGLNPA